MSGSKLFACTVLLCWSAIGILPAATFDPGAEPPYAAALLMEAETGALLYAHNPYLQRSPASTQKLLFKLIVMDLVAQGQAALTDLVRVSARASRMGGSQVYLKHGEVFTLEELMEAIAIPSANDACVAVAEHLSGSVENFVELMNDYARRLNLEQTYCVNVHGLDDTPLDNRNLTSAHDLAQITRRLLAYPQVLAWSSIRYKPFRQGKFMLYTTNNLLGKYAGMDGIKTGYTRRAGFCLVATAQRDDMRLISVVLGAPSKRIRDTQTRRLLEWGFDNFARVPIVQAGEPLGQVALRWGLEKEVRVFAQDTVIAVLSNAQQERLARRLDLPADYPAPIRAGQQLGALKIALEDSVLARVEAVAEKTVRRMTVWEKLISYF